MNLPGCTQNEVAETPQENCSPFASAELPCGRVVRNRLVKVAMYEHLAALFGGPPNEHHLSLYSAWAKSGWGMIITGEFSVSKDHLTLARDMVLPNKKEYTTKDILPYAALADCIHGKSAGNDALAIMQLLHAGRQSPNILGGRLPFFRPLAPSAVPVGTSPPNANIATRIINSLFFVTPKAMSFRDIDEVIECFVRAAELARDAGFDGVELHAAHGYLLTQFMSAKSNSRTDNYSVDNESGLFFLKRVVTGIRAVVPKAFVLGIKLNAADYVNGSESTNTRRRNNDEQNALDHVRIITEWNCVDFLEISGGDYENPSFMATTGLERRPRQAFFQRFSRLALETVLTSASVSNTKPPLILLTGGLRNPYIIRNALVSRRAQLLGFGRASVLRPDLPELIRRRSSGIGVDADDELRPLAPEPDLGIEAYGWVLRLILKFMPKVKLIGASQVMAWYTVKMREIALAEMRQSRGATKTDIYIPAISDLPGPFALVSMWLWILPSDIEWMKMIRLFLGVVLGYCLCIFWQ